MTASGLRRSRGGWARFPFRFIDGTPIDLTDLSQILRLIQGCPGDQDLILEDAVTRVYLVEHEDGEGVTWDEAEENCRRGYNGHLATIDERPEADAVSGFLDDG